MRIAQVGTVANLTHLRARAILQDVEAGKKIANNAQVDVSKPNATSFTKHISLTPLTQTMINRFNQNQLNKEFDLIIIGGGINGCGIARDASERGLSVLLLEKDDFGYGCTSASTRLFHGGLRYLEHFEFDLVRESLLEREILLANANHLVRPIQICIPIYKGDKRGYWRIFIGMLLYDLLSFGKSLPNHKMLPPEEFIQQEAGVRQNDLLGAAVYSDAQLAYPERLCIENILMAKKEGAIVLNHAEVVALNVDSERISSLEFVDHLSNSKFKVRGKLIVNVSGPWVDSLCGLVDKGIERKIGGTKGSHIIVRKFDKGPSRAIYATAKSDGRPFFIVPWGEFYLIGTTDIPFDGDLDHLKATEDEIKYLLEEANNIFDTKKIKREDILFSYCGVRPLPFQEGLEVGKITRRHILLDHVSDDPRITNFISVIGGKLTTYRNLSEQAVDLSFKKLGYPYVPTLTRTRPLIGNVEGDLETFKSSQLRRTQKKYDLDADIILHLIDLYGKRYKEILDFILAEPNLGKLLSSSSLDVRAQVEHAVQRELAYTISDIFLRRTTLGLSEGLGQDAISEVAKQLQQLLGYSSSDIQKQISDYDDKVLKLRIV